MTNRIITEITGTALPTSLLTRADGDGRYLQSGEIGAWGTITGSMAAQADLVAALALKLDDSQATATGLSVLGISNSAALTALIGTFTSSLAGSVPASGGGSTNFLRADGSWAVPTSSGGTWGSITGTLGSQSDLIAALNLKAPLASPTFTGTVNAATITASSAVTGSNLSGTNTGDESNATILSKLSAASGGGSTNYLRADGTWAAPAGGGSGLTDGDKGDITVSASGATWTIDANAVSLSKLATQATATILGNTSGSTAVPSALTATQITAMLNEATGSLKGLMSSSDFTKLAAISGTNTGDQTITLTGNVTGTGTGSFATTIASNAVTLANMAQVATATFLGRTTASTGNVEALSATQATALLNSFTSSLKGLAPASGGGTTTFLRADGTWAAPTPTLADGDMGDVVVSGSGTVLTVERASGNNFTITGNHPSSWAGTPELAIGVQAGGIKMTAIHGGVNWVPLTLDSHDFKIQYGGSTRFTSDGAGMVINGQLRVTDDAYASGWNTNLECPTKNSIYDKIETLAPLASPTFTGTVTLPATGEDTNGNNAATTNMVHSVVNSGSHVTTGGATTLETTNAYRTTLRISGTLTSNATMNFWTGSTASLGRIYTVINDTTGAYTLTLSPCVTSPTTTITIAQGATRIVRVAAANIYDITPSAAVSDGDKGDITVASSGSSWTIDTNAVSLSKMATVATATFLGRTTASTGNVESLTATQATALLDAATTSLKGAMSAADKTKLDGIASGATANTGTVTSVTLTQPAAGITLTNSGSSQTTAASSTVALANDLAAVEGLSTTGIVRRTATDTWSAGTAVALSELAAQAATTFVANSTGGSAAPTAISTATATGLLDDFAGSSKGMVPGSAGGTTNFLRADGAWAAPPGTGGVTDGDKGDITISSSGATYTIDNDAVTFAKMQNIATGSFVGRLTASTGDMEVITAQDATTMISTMGAASGGAGGDRGLAPATAAGDQAKFLRGDATWQTVTGNTTNSLTLSNAGSGDASGSTFNGSAAKTISYNSIGAAPTASPTFTGTVSAAAATLTGLLTTVASATGSAGIRIPHGAAPTTPTNGDLWTTTTGLFARLNGTTAQFAPLASPTFTGTVTASGISLGTGDITLSTGNLTLSTGSISASLGSVTVPTINNSAGVAVQYNGSTKLATVTGGVNVTGVLGAMEVNHSLGVNLQYNGSNKLTTLTGGAAVTGTLSSTGAFSATTGTFSSTISATNKVDGFGYSMAGLGGASDVFPIGKAPYAFTVSQTNSSATGLVAATASTVYTLKKGTIASPTTIGTFTFAASGTVATVSITAGTVSSGDMLWIEGPATADTTLKHIGFVVKS